MTIATTQRAGGRGGRAAPRASAAGGVRGVNVAGRRDGGVQRWLLLAASIAILVVILFPVYYTVVVSLEPASTLLASTAVVIPHHITFSNFQAAGSAELGNILTSLLVSLGVVVVTLAIATPAAHGLARFRLRTTTVVVFALLVVQMVPGISLSLAFYVMFDKLHLLNGYIGLVLADSTYAVPFAVLVLRAYMSSVPETIFEAAAIDGCGHGRSFLLIGVPLALPGIITAGLFSFLFGWGDFLFALTLNSGGSVQPVTLGLYKFVQTIGENWGPMMATVVMAAVPAGILLAVAQRWISGGLQAGALKG